jgi:ABC-2 type transport system permease protein
VISAFTNQFLIATDFQIHNLKPTFSVKEESTNQRTLSYFDFVLMGLIGLALMNASVQGIAITMANYREDQILKRLTTTPLKTWKFVGAEVLSRLVLNVLQVGLILSIGYFGFHAHIYGNIFLIFVFALLGGLLFQSLGFLVASVAKTTDAAQGMAVAITIPMMFLAGVFFPIDQLPKWLSMIVQYLPLAPLLRMIRTIGLEASSPFANPINIAIVIGWIVIALAVSVWRFRLTDE